MSKVQLRKTRRARRKLRVRKKVSGTKAMPRLTVFRSNKYTYGQIIDDIAGKTLVGLSENDVKKFHKDKTKAEAALAVGEALAAKAKEVKIKTVVFDRNGYIYHGRVKNIADGARKGGLSL